MDSKSDEKFGCIDIRVKEGLVPINVDYHNNGVPPIDAGTEPMDSLSAIETKSDSGTGNRNESSDGKSKDSAAKSGDNWSDTSVWPPNERPAVGRQVKCYNCGQFGHRYQNCLRPKDRRDNRYERPNQSKDWNRDNVWPTQQKSQPKCWLKLDEYYLSQCLSDITFVVEGQTLFGHRFVLGAKSKHFQKMLFDKNGSNTAIESNVQLDDTNVEAFKLVLRYLYLDSLDDKDIDCRKLIDALKLANRYELKTLTELINKRLIACLNVNNIVEVYKAYIEYDLKQLSQPLDDFIGDNALAIVESKTLSNEPLELTARIMAAFRSQKAIITATKAMIDCNKAMDLESIKSLIRLDQCSIDDIVLLKEIGLFDVNHLFDTLLLKLKTN